MDKMSESIKEEEVTPETSPGPIAPPPRKEFFLMVDEIQMSLLSRVLPGIQYVEVQGMNIKDEPNHLLLVTPIKVEPKVENGNSERPV
jgi:hypothetical protein